MVDTPALERGRSSAAAAVPPPGRRTALSLGLLYVAMGVPAAVDFMLIRPTFVASRDADGTAINLLGGELLFRLGIALQFTASIAALFLAAAYYGHFARVHRFLARLLVLFIIMGSLIEMGSASLGVMALSFIKQPDHLAVFEPQQLNAIGLSILGFQSFGYVMAHIFWGLWLLPLGLLVIRSKWLPKAVGLLLLAAAGAYVAVGFTTILVPSAARQLAQWAVIPEGIGECLFMLWLIFFGFKKPSGATPSDHVIADASTSTSTP